jgi:alpha-galactosidase
MTAQQVAQTLYGQFGDALRSAGRPMVYSLTTHAASLATWTWAPCVGNMWMTTGPADIHDSYAALVHNFAQNAPHYRAAGPGGWNDPDMLEVGNGGMTAAEDRTEFSLWAEMAAPLLAGNDLTTMSSATRATLTNRDVIAVDQDPLGRQARLLTSANGHWVLTKPLANGARAVVLFNATTQRAVITTTARRVGLPSAPRYRLDHLWSHTRTRTTGTISANLAPHAVAMVRVTPTRG